MASQQQSPRFSEGIRRVINDLQAEDDLQKKITARIVGAAAQISNNHDRLIEEVAEVARQDLDSVAAKRGDASYTVAQLKQQFPTLKRAKEKLGLKAKSWKALVEKLNARPLTQQTSADQEPMPELNARLRNIELQLSSLQDDVKTILMLLSTTQSTVDGTSESSSS